MNNKTILNTKTLDNLVTAFMHESQAKMRYEYYAKQAEKDGYIQIKNIFNETAKNEAEHAKRFYKFLKEDLKHANIKTKAVLPVTLDNTVENLKSAISGEEEEASYLYPLFSEIAKSEGFQEISHVFHEISEVEEAHQDRFQCLLDNIKEDRVFKRDEDVEWKCNNCGYIHKGKEAPNECPACAHGQEHFEIFVKTY